MRFSFAESMCDPSHFLPLAGAAVGAGWDAFTIPDSICYPEVSDSTYPYTPDGRREFLEGKPFIEPFSLIPAMAAVTERLRFTTFVVKLPIRNPVLVAKQVTSVACLAENRFAFGVGLSPWPEDFAVCGQEWKGRGRRMDEMIEIIRGLSTGDFFAYQGRYYDIQSIKLCPVPAQPVPIMIGGHSDLALRRAARRPAKPTHAHCAVQPARSLAPLPWRARAAGPAQFERDAEQGGPHHGGVLTAGLSRRSRVLPVWTRHSA